MKYKIGTKVKIKRSNGSEISGEIRGISNTLGYVIKLSDGNTIYKKGDDFKVVDKPVRTKKVSDQERRRFMEAIMKKYTSPEGYEIR